LEVQREFLGAAPPVDGIRMRIVIVLAGEMKRVPDPQVEGQKDYLNFSLTLSDARFWSE
jgi:hypothetical protein